METRFHRDTLGVLGMFLLIFLTSSFSVTSNALSSAATIVCWVALLLLLMFQGYTTPLNQRVFFAFFALAALFFISAFFNGDNLFSAIKNLFALTTAFLYVNLFDYRSILRYFVKVMVFISVLSIPLFLISLTSPSAFSSFLAPGTNGRWYYNFYLFSHMLGNDRNCGLFWEPGAFSTFLNFAILIFLLDDRKKSKKEYLSLCILLAALATTFSTAGYMGLVLVLLTFILDKQKDNKRKSAIVFFIAVAVTVVMTVYYDQIFGSESLVFGKVDNFVEYQDIYLSGDKVSSTSVRWFSFIKPLEIFLENPIFGVGHARLSEMTFRYTYGAITCTFVNWFAINGFLYGSLVLWGYITLCTSSKKRSLVKILLFLTCMTLIFAEDYSQNALFLGVALLGYKVSTKEKEKINVRR